MLTLSAGIAAEIQKTSVRYCRLIAINLETPIYLTDHYKDVPYGGNTYDTSAHLESMSNLKQSGIDRNPQVTVNLSGVDQTYYSLFLSNNYVSRTATIYIAFLDSNDAIIDDPLEVYSGSIVDISMKDDPFKGTAKVGMMLGGPFDDFDRRVGRRTNTESQKEFFPTDVGFDFAGELDPPEYLWDS